MMNQVRSLAAASIVAVMMSSIVSPQPVGASTVDESADFETIAGLDELTGDHATAFRLYWAFFQRQPDPEGALYWITEIDDCVGLDTIADSFSVSAEFGRRYGETADRDFVELIYRNVLDRPADPDGLGYWTGLLARRELTRGGVVLYVSLSPEFVGRHRYPSDGVPPRACSRPDSDSTGRRVEAVEGAPLATVAGLTIVAPSALIERAGFHQSSHPGALAMSAADPSPVRLTTMASRRRGTHERGAIDIVAEPYTAITSPVSGTVARAGGYTLYCRYRDGYVVINPDGRADLEVKILHIQNVAVRKGQRVAVGDRLASGPTTFPFRSQVDELTAEPSWPHVHIEVVDPTIPRKPSPGSC
ncbi:MAG: DUF4214 domain-containing protein [Acidimicrobiales bacterium]